MILKINKGYLNIIGFLILYLVVLIWFIVKDLPLYMTITLTVCYIASLLYKIKSIKRH